MPENVSQSAPALLAPWEQEQMTPRQRKMFATCAANMEAETGRTLAQWVEIAQTCPDTTVRGRMDWLDQRHGVRAMRAHILMAAAFGDAAPTPDALADALWKDPALRRFADQIIARARALPDVIVGQRKGYTAFSRTVQFAAIRPVKGRIRLGLALAPDASPLLTLRGRSESLQDRLISVIDIPTDAALEPRIGDLLRQAWDGA